MREKYLRISADDKIAILGIINNYLATLSCVKFAYVHGSFIEEDEFHDIDLAIYLSETTESAIEQETDLELSIGKIIPGYPIDVRILNKAPLSFRYNVIKLGKPVAVADDDARADFETSTFSRYFDFARYRDMYLKETLGRDI